MIRDSTSKVKGVVTGSRILTDRVNPCKPAPGLVRVPLDDRLENYEETPYP